LDLRRFIKLTSSSMETGSTSGTGLSGEIKTKLLKVEGQPIDENGNPIDLKVTH